ncbi:MAG: biopolymer transporter ExbD [bacterium]|nr:biopolymer transporter ExbD [bacterium]
MNFRKRQSALPQFQMTAMMDIVFLLLCFFVTSTVFSQWEYTMDIQLPSAKSGKIAAAMSFETKLNINKEGVVTVQGVTYTGKALDTFLERLAAITGPNDAVIVRADAKTPYEEFMKVVDACKRVGIQNLSLSTVETDAVAEEVPDLPML